MAGGSIRRRAWQGKQGGDICNKGFPSGPDGKESAWNAGDPGRQRQAIVNEEKLGQEKYS